MVNLAIMRWLWRLLLVSGCFWGGCRPEEPSSAAVATNSLAPRLNLSQTLSGQEAWPREPRTDLAPFVDEWAAFALPADFRRLLRARFDLDQLQTEFYAWEEELLAQPDTGPPVAPSRGQAIDIIRFDLPSSVRSYRQSLPERVVPLRGFKAPILEDAGQNWPVTPMPSNGSAAEAAAARQVEENLATDGLLATLVQVVAQLSPDKLTADHAQALDALRRVGFPIDLLAFFADEKSVGRRESPQVLWQVAESLAAGAPVAEVQATLAGRSFRFRPSHPEFQVSLESGEQEIGLMRLQAGGGYRGGILPGGSIDIIAQLVQALPEADFLVSVPEPFLRDLNRLARLHWTLVRSNQVIMVGEPFPVSAWTQDNGKAGLLVSSNATPYQVATLTPRYACLNEGNSEWAAGESFLMDGVNAAGHPVIHSPLLFQGGNLLPIFDPVRGARILLLGEAALYRNRALGLTRDQVMEAFRMEFAVDRCVVMPAVSFHLDFDVSMRRHGDQLIAFVNDTRAATRLILERGIEALQAQGALEPTTGSEIRHALQAGNDEAVHQRLASVMKKHVDQRGRYSVDLQRWFAVDPSDAPAYNLKAFLTALDLLASRVMTAAQLSDHPQYARYLGALRHIESSLTNQQAVLRQLGWKLVPVPSLPDLGCGMHYLNGIHDATRYFMPAQGGFYESMDVAVAQVFYEALGSEVEIVPILTTEAQRLFGAIHCAAAAYPRIDSSKNQNPRKGS